MRHALLGPTFHDPVLLIFSIVRPTSIRLRIFSGISLVAQDEHPEHGVARYLRAESTEKLGSQIAGQAATRFKLNQGGVTHWKAELANFQGCGTQKEEIPRCLNYRPTAPRIYNLSCRPRLKVRLVDNPSLRKAPSRIPATIRETVSVVGRGLITEDCVRRSLSFYCVR